MVKYKKDYVTIGLAQCIIDAWKEYKEFEKVLVNRLKERGFKEISSWDAESFISDNVIGTDMDDALEFERAVKLHLEKQTK